ncbi:bifunctional adenosylcobinamide kinase/adenosylcobinamide-phosphate guanylyltransferase [Oceaniglobus ichthyenteri]|uniref:bifunctional adenosylcobinamide kinase/adenosylcobinamide-phosphate guanylyltransferase n=1 Tax=Oceaniglobus ichthyenteri TaxID=2136177 RepID=UPI000D3789EB|nr:bifunctional adenosylcobinamide kinase/adenosylcobinamide-phosphate guanylyltransferase [Oceaniglobus ichthyenteri]
MLPNLSLVLGGANSGKSAFSELLLRNTGLPRTYIATAQAFDSEMADKISAHRAARGTEWHTVEAPLRVAEALTECAADGIALLDCATLWLSNHLLANSDLEHECTGLMTALQNAPCPVVVVSNEVGQGIVPDNQLARQFRAAQGRLNQRIAAQAGLVVSVIAGLPMVLKGALPKEMS